MITFLISVVILLLGYFVYSKILEKVFKIDDKATTPAYSMQDGVDYVPMKPWRVFMIQFLNIAGLGPIFGAIMGAKFGTASFLWIVFGSIFAGGVHDYLSGMLSLRKNGASLPEIYGEYLGKGVRVFMRYFTVLLLILVGVVFVYGPAGLLNGLLPSISQMSWIVIIVVYYILATMLPVDKIIGKLYPIFGASLLFMALGLMVAMFYNQIELPELWHGLGNKSPNPESTPIFPMMFITIACGAISGFHGTQSPMMARCLENEKYGRPIFYGAMIAEGIVALIWAAVATYFFYDPSRVGNVDINMSAPFVVDFMTKHWLGTFGAILALIGVIVAPITSGDTSFRSARLIVASSLNFDQKPIKNRLYVSVPLFLLGILILIYAVNDKNGFDVIWRYFAWSNQVVATVTLWAVTVYLTLNKKPYIISLIPALFMTMVCSTFIFIAKKEGFGLSHQASYSIGILITVFVGGLFFKWKSKKMV